MMQVSKIHLSPAETELMKDAQIILTKNSILQKIKLLLEEVQVMQTSFVSASENLSVHIRNQPKISRGENYLGLPYLILDYPRETTGAGFLFIRTMFWWGNFFSSTLHVSGVYKLQYEENLTRFYPLLENHFIGVNSDPWIHHFENDNYRPVADLTQKDFENICKSLDHIKIAAKWPLDGWQVAPPELFANWKLLLEGLFSSPTGEKDL